MTGSRRDLFDDVDGPDPGGTARDDAAGHELRGIYFRHREALTAGNPLPLEERETDRLRVNELYPDLPAGPDRMLDARTLGTLVDSQAATQRAAMMNLVAPEERLQMLAVVVRRHSFPVAMISRRGLLSLSPLLGRSMPGPDRDLAIDADQPADPAPADLPVGEQSAITVVPVDPDAVETRRLQLADRLRDGLTRAELDVLSEDDAQLLSVIASNATVRLVALPDGGLQVVDAPEEVAGEDPPGSRPRSFCLNYRRGVRGP